MKIIYLVFCFILVVVYSPYCSAFEPKYAVHTSKDDIDYKKQKALNWYSGNIENQKFYFYDGAKHVSYLKNKALSWYEDRVNNGKFYYVNPTKELEFQKNKALKWYERNSQ